MKKICLCFQIHQPNRLRRYRFFDIGNDSNYYDEVQNEEIFDRIATESYLPANQLMLDLLRLYPNFQISYIVSGIAIEQIERRDDLLTSFRELASTGRVDFLAETYAHSLTSLYDKEEWRAQIKMQQSKLQELFSIKPSRVLCNTELIYNDDIAREAEEMGFEAILTEGAKHVLSWQSPNYIYQSQGAKSLKVLMRHPSMSNLIAQEFARYDSPEYPVTADKLLNRIKWQPDGEDFVILYMNYEALGSMNRAETGIFEFFRALPKMADLYDITFATPSTLIDEYSVAGTIAVTSPISGASEECTVNTWLGNNLQMGVMEKLRAWGPRVRATRDNKIWEDWLYLQSADHFYYMNNESRGFSPYTSSYDAFNNYMNVLSDFLLRVERCAPLSVELEELNNYESLIAQQSEQIASLKAELEQLKSELAPSKKKPRTTKTTKASK